MDAKAGQTFSDIRERLEEIAAQVKGDDVSLDAALDLYDEAVKLGIRGTELLESLDEPLESEEEPRP